jgi:hypothetical protein
VRIEVRPAAQTRSCASICCKLHVPAGHRRNSGRAGAACEGSNGVRASAGEALREVIVTRGRGCGRRAPNASCRRDDNPDSPHTSDSCHRQRSRVAGHRFWPRRWPEWRRGQRGRPQPSICFDPGYTRLWRKRWRRQPSKRAWQVSVHDVLSLLCGGKSSRAKVEHVTVESPYV